MNLSADRLEVTAGERLRVALIGATWTVTASAHTSNELEDVGLRVLSITDTLPAGDAWAPGKVDAPGFPQTIVWAELEPKASASLQRQLTDDLYVARAWSAPSSSSVATTTHPLHPYDVDPVAPAVMEGRVVMFRRAYVWGRGVAAP